MTDHSPAGIVFFTYILFSRKSSRYYIGQTQQIWNRLEQHNSGFVRSTKPYVPWEMVGFIEKSSRKEAIVLERKLKNLNTEDLKKFIDKYFPCNLGST